jgi:hypothetical protein
MTDARIADSIADKWDWLRAVFVHTDRTLAQAAVAAALAQHFNIQHGAAWPAERTICDWTRLDRRNVQRAIAALKVAGFLAVDPGGPRRATRYALLMDAVERPQRTPRSVHSGRPPASTADAPQRPEKERNAKRSGSDPLPPAADARGSGFADATPPPRAGGGRATSKTKPARRRAPRTPAPVAAF